jgi:hypothetical protein
MSERKPVRTSSTPRAASSVAVAAYLAPGHTLALGTVATGKPVYDLLRLTPEDLGLIGRKRADGAGNTGDEAWA